jgi:hypothetical protein
LTENEQQMHCVASSRGLVVSATRETLAENARWSLPARSRFMTARDPAKVDMYFAFVARRVS